ncbi:hypothetical protein KFK09_024852 [Dendrobium nobile]|uniref:Uncharacterized protein n=1 Tax=Dendrobium nobile TaxID=94219 RepID=A0A8T3AEX9_DENNO|nr:hypothetical protein KFK09_024852 [Dendrobium nobile]
MASNIAPGLMEAYVTRKLYKEKMKTMEEEFAGGQVSKNSDKEGKKMTFFGLLKKKVHPKCRGVLD